MQKHSRVFAAGGTGLVGSAIIKKLQEKGYTNIVANYHSRPPVTTNQYTNNQYTNTQPTNTPITWQKLDLLNTSEVEKFFKLYKPEFVFLAAAKVGGIVANNRYRADFIYENLQIQNNVIYQSYKHGVKKLMFLGSTCIYPKECPQPMKEEYLLTAPLEYTNEPYAIAKIAGIKMCESFNLQYGTNFISVMPTNLYGPNDNFDLEKSHVLPALLRKMHLGKLLESGDFDTIKKDMIGMKSVIGNSSLVISDESSNEEILQVLNHYGIKYTNTPLTTNHSPNNQSTQPSVAIEIWGSGSPRREFLWSEDMADACVFLMESVDFEEISNLSIGNSYTGQNSNTQTPNPPITNNKYTSTPITNNEYTNTPVTNLPITNNEIRNTHINIGTGIDISIKELAELIKQIVGFKGELYYNTDKPDGTPVKLTDVSKLNSLGWQYKMDLESGIKEMYNWYLKETNDQ
ncbi:MAG: NAD-dependent epimerase/dehydratase family protein [Flexistipes sinusarabici]|uniref:GDP-L-fucose synthase n=1 Tax=Flexistipes sinusarabici TaxID=2352 RepID=A0A5D0MFE1_FLESI|nr:MAG: NAD-dependent epimerase/dehydratase family protein [Flexistipes sinusarabici]